MKSASRLVNVCAAACLMVLANEPLQAKQPVQAAVPPPGACRPLSFPSADAAHASRNEWWRVLAHLKATTGERYDVAVTLAKFAVRPGASRSALGRWSAAHIMPATAAVVDESEHRMTYDRRLERDSLGLASASLDHLDVRVGDWSLRGARASAWRRQDMRLHVTIGNAVVDLRQSPVKAAVAYDDRPACAYAYTRLRTRGIITLGGIPHAVSGDGWLDHEFSSVDLGHANIESERFAIQLDDGRELLLSVRHDRVPHGAVRSSGVLVDAAGTPTRLGPRDFTICNPLATTFTSPTTQFRYPSLWLLSVPRAGFELAAVPPVQDQEIASSDLSDGTYNGTLDVESAPPPDRFHGRGFVETTYRARNEMRGGGSPASRTPPACSKSASNVAFSTSLPREIYALRSSSSE